MYNIAEAVTEPAEAEETVAVPPHAWTMQVDVEPAAVLKHPRAFSAADLSKRRELEAVGALGECCVSTAWNRDTWRIRKPRA